MSVLVHLVSGAPRPWRVLLGFTFKGVSYDTHYLEASKGEHKSEDYAKLNPRLTVPTVEADGMILRDSIGILAWMDRRYPDKPLFGKTPDEAGRIWQVVMECNDYLRAAMGNLLVPILVKNDPLPAEGSGERIMQQMAANELMAEYDYLENFLADGPFLCGAKASAADAIAFPEIRVVQRALERKTEHMEALGLMDIAARYPKIEAWKNRIEALPGVDKTMPIHW